MNRVVDPLSGSEGSLVASIQAMHEEASVAKPVLGTHVA